LSPKQGSIEFKSRATEVEVAAKCFTYMQAVGHLHKEKLIAFVTVTVKEEPDGHLRKEKLIAFEPVTVKEEPVGHLHKEKLIAFVTFTVKEVQYTTAATITEEED